MKSAYELALERTGGALEEVEEGKKEKITEIDNKYKAKIAEAELALRQRLVKADGDVAQREQIENDFTVEIASIRSKCEREKEKIRKP